MMSIPLIGAVQSVTTAGITPAVQSVPAGDSSNFAASLGGAIDNLQQLQNTSDSLAVQAVTGNLSDISDMSKRQETPVLTELLSPTR